MVLRRIVRPVVALGIAFGSVAAGAGVASACGGLVAPGHAEALKSATTLAAWHAGYEHYVTGFEFAGLADSFGYIIPLPGVPSKIGKGGEWTLERLQGQIGEGPLSVERRVLFAAGAAAPSVQVLQQVKIDALNITVVRGGGADVARWASKNGFDLTRDAPSVLGRYSSSHAVFALARFDRADARSRGLIQGQGEVIQFTIPLKAPWVPLRILALGKTGAEFVDAEVFVLTDDRPTFSPTIGSIDGMSVKADEAAPAAMLRDLSGDEGMSWVPKSGMWFTALKLRTTASTVTYDLSIDGGGPVGAPPAPIGRQLPVSLGWPFWTALVLGVGGLLLIARRERDRARPVPARVR
jgi:hypothetical protein